MASRTPTCRSGRPSRWSRRWPRAVPSTSSCCSPTKATTYSPRRTGWRTSAPPWSGCGGTWGSPTPSRERSVGGADLLADRLPELAEQPGEPRQRRVEGLAALDPGELDGAQLVAALLVLADHPAAAVQGDLGGQVGAAADEREVLAVRRRRAREVPALL